MISSFYKNTPAQRRQILIENHPHFSEKDIHILAGELNDETNLLDKMSENIIGACRIPLGVLTGILVDDIEHSVAMATEEPSVIAAVNRACKIINNAGGIKTQVQKPAMTAQIAFIIPKQYADDFKNEIINSEKHWLECANACDPILLKNDGGAYKLNIQILHQNSGSDKNEVFMIIYLHVYTADAMGANCINTMAETLLNEINSKYQIQYNCKPVMAILSNRCHHRMVNAICTLSQSCLSEINSSLDEPLGIKLERASVFADLSPERAITHNKGILNGIIAAAVPLGQDIRAIEAAAYDFACKDGIHKPLSTWRYHHNQLSGQISMPLVVGYIGGFKSNPAFDAAFKFAQIDSYTKLCGLLAAVGLAQNMAALWALSTEGIQAGHMKLHQRKNCHFA